LGKHIGATKHFAYNFPISFLFTNSLCSRQRQSLFKESKDPQKLHFALGSDSRWTSRISLLKVDGGIDKAFQGLLLEHIFFLLSASVNVDEEFRIFENSNYKDQ